jgi:taurine dioxygenase
VEVTRLSAALGAEVQGIDLARADGDLVSEIRCLLQEHLVLFFREQHLSVEAHVRLGEALGGIYRNPAIEPVDEEHPGASIHRGDYVTNYWHSDGQPRRNPVRVTILKMVTCPSSGGDTMWANQHAAYEELSAPIRDLLDGLTAQHTSAAYEEERWTHPAVLLHPETGRKLLYVSRHNTVRLLELSPGESDALLGYLFDWSVRPDLVCRYRWTAGTVAIWDNLATLHYALADFDEPRVTHRVMVDGSELEDFARRWPALTRAERSSRGVHARA